MDRLSDLLPGASPHLPAGKKWSVCSIITQMPRTWQMKRPALLLFVLLLTGGCFNRDIRVSAYAPRRDDTQAHREATTSVDCIGCHSIEGLRSHQSDDNCLRCHKINKGY